MSGSRRQFEVAFAEHLIDKAHTEAAIYAAERTEPPWGENVLSRAIYYDYQRLRAEQRAAELAQFEADQR